MLNSSYAETMCILDLFHLIKQAKGNLIILIKRINDLRPLLAISLILCV